MPTEFQVFTFVSNEGLTFPQWLKARDDEGWELITVLYCSSGPVWTTIQCAFRNKV